VQFYSIEILSGKTPFPDGVDPTKRELYLSDESFRQVCPRVDIRVHPILACANAHGLGCRV
jgi:hypothetical protein